MLVGRGPIVVAVVHGLVLAMVFAWIALDARRTRRRAPMQRLIRLPEPRQPEQQVIDLRERATDAAMESSQR